LWSHNKFAISGAGAANTNYLNKQRPRWKETYTGFEDLKVAVIGLHSQRTWRIEAR